MPPTVTQSSSQMMTKSDRAFAIPAFLSGAAALAYETLWGRLAAFSFGADAPAAGAVLAATMIGLGLGAILIRSRCDRLSPAKALKLFAILEISAACYALASPTILELAGQLAGSIAGDGLSLTIARAVAALVAIVPGAILLGSTFPALAQAAASKQRDPSAAASLAYVINLSGAALGAPIASLILVPSVGIRASLLAAALASTTAAMLAIHFSRSLPHANQAPQSPQAPTGPPSTQGTRLPAIPIPMIAAASALVGLRTLGLEGLSSRILRLAIGGGAHAFALMLSCFILGLAIAGLLAEALPRRHTLRLIIVSELVSLIAIAQFSHSVPNLQQVVLDATLAGSNPTAIQLSLSLQTLLPIALSTGCTLPLLLKLSGDKGLRGAAWVYGANALGAACGALLAPLLFVPVLGLQGALVSLALLGSLAPVLLILVPMKEKTPRLQTAGSSGFNWLFVPAAATILWITSGQQWTGAALTQGVYAMLDAKQQQQQQGKIVFLRAGLNCLVSVEDRPELNARVLKTDGKIEGAVPIDITKPSRADLSTPIALASFPFLLSTKTPQNACVIGLGTGVTLGALLSYKIKHIDAVEIEPAVVAALTDPGELFNLSNKRPLSSPSVSLHIIDACAHLRASKARYDLITSQPSDPWLSGSSALLTQDTYRLAKAALRPGGIFCQWLQLYGLDSAALRSNIQTFLSVFPSAIAIQPPGSAEILLLSGPQKLDLSALRERLKEATKNKNPRGKLSDLLSCFLSGPKYLGELAGDAPIETINHPRLAYRNAGSQGHATQQSSALLQSLARGAGELLQLLTGSPKERLEALHDAAQAAALLKNRSSAVAMVEAGLKFKESSQGHRLLGDLICRPYGDSPGNPINALEHWRRSISLDPGAIEPRNSIALYLLSKGQADQAVQILIPLLKGPPARQAAAHALLGRIAEATMKPLVALRHYQQAGGVGAAKQRAQALKAKLNAEGKLPKVEVSPKLLAKAGRRQLRKGNFRGALPLLEAATSKDPASPKPWLDLARTKRALHRLPGALWAAEKALGINPALPGLCAEHSGILRDLKRYQESRQTLLDGLTAAQGARELRLRAVLCNDLLQDGLNKQALQQAERLLAVIPRHLLGLAYQGMALAKLSRNQEARMSYLRFLANAPRNHFMRGAIQEWMDKNPP